MTERIQVIVEAKDAASGVLRAITSQFGALGNLVEDLASPAGNWGNISSSAANLVVDGVREAIRYTGQYVNEVHDLSLASGQSMEASSRMIQVLDDYGLTTQDALTATRALTKEGYAPTIETLAELSDQYNKLGSAEAKNEFIMKNLGRGGLEWAKALQQGGEALKAQAAAVSDTLIVTDQLYRDTREYEIAVDDLTDAWNGFKVEVGGAVLPVLTDVLTRVQAIGLAEDQLRSEGIAYGTAQWWERRQVLIETAEAEIEADRAAKIHTDTLNGQTGVLEDNTEALKNASQARQAELANMFTIQGAEESYQKTLEDNATKRNDLIHEQMDLQAEFAKRQAQNVGGIAATDTQWFTDQKARIADLEALVDRTNGKDANAVTALAQARYIYNQALEDSAKLQKNSVTDVDWFIEQQDKINNVTQQIKDLDQANADAKQANTDATNKLVYSMLQQRAAQDGLVSPEEEEFLMKTAVDMGLISQASADASIAASKLAETMWNSFTKTADPNGPMQTTRDLMYDMADLDGYVVNFGVNFFTTGGIPSLPGNTTWNGFLAGQNNHPGGGGMAAGGDVTAGRVYWVGEQGPEPFVPFANGHIYSNEQARGMGNVTINITGIVDQQMVDYLAQEITKAQTQ